MNSEFRFLDQLENDLRDAAARERGHEPEQPWSRQQLAPARASSKRWRPTWLAVAAAFVTLLVVAGTIGFLSQLGHENRAGSVSDVGGGVSGGGVEPGSRAQASTAPAPAAGAPGLDDKEAARLNLFAGANPSSDAAHTLNQGQAAGTRPPPPQDLSKIIRDGTITVVVPKGDFGTAFDQATGIAEAAGGFVLSSSISQENQGTLTIRVPSRKLDGAIVKLRALGRLAELTLTGKDVTASYIDLKARLGVLQTQRELIVKLLKASTTVSGQLSLSSRFAEVQTQIEQIQGQLNVLNDKVDLATLRVTLREEGVAAPESDDEIRNPSLGSAWDRAVQGFLGVIAAVVVGLGYLVPILVLAGLILGLRLLLIRSRRREAS
jgi:Domain of unknown function (DUF4349)